MSNAFSNRISLSDIARQAMIDRGFIPDFPESALQELIPIQLPATPLQQASLRDLRDLLWVSIDNDDSRDLDQLTFAEKPLSEIDKIYVAIADVDALVKRGSAIDNYAAHNTTSVYTPTIIFPMLPSKLSTDLTSLGENADRCAIVIEIEIGSDGRFDLCDIYPAWVRNHARLAYNGVAAWLENKTSLPSIPGLLEQLMLQDSIAQRIQKFRYRQGALSFASTEIQPIIVNGLAVGLQERIYNRAHVLIENFMIAANVAATRYLAQRKQPTLRRIVRIPKRWDRIVDLAKGLREKLPPQPDVKALRNFLLQQQQANPLGFQDLSLAIIKLIGRGEYILGLPDEPTLGHFDLALRDYAHSTAPNRRFPDLIMQRLLKSCLNGIATPYRNEELSSLAEHCTQKEDDATKVERHLHKSAAAMVLSAQIGQLFKAMVTGSGENGTWVRLLTLPVEGKLVHGFQGMDVGDHLIVKLVHVDIPNGHIDFSRS